MTSEASSVGASQEPHDGRLETLWARVNPWVGIAAFGLGFAWDAVTLVRVDRVWDNLYLATCLLGLGLLLVVDHRVSQRPEAWPRLAPWLGWLGYAVQFLFGGLLSAYVVFYFQSTSAWPQAIFLVLLVGLLFANEFAFHLLSAEGLRVTLYGFCLFSFLLFAIPVFTGFAGRGLFVLAGALAAAGAGGVVLAMGPAGPEDVTARTHVASVAGLLLALSVLDGLGLIPPIPFALVEQGMFHGVEVRNEPDPTGVRRANRYALSWEDRGIWSRLQGQDQVFLLREGDKAWYFTAVFAPSGMTLSVQHRWERYSDTQEAWLTTDTIDVSSAKGLIGGAASGFRTYSVKGRLEPGAWRVMALLDDRRVVGGTDFEVRQAGPDTSPPVLIERIYD